MATTNLPAKVTSRQFLIARKAKVISKFPPGVDGDAIFQQVVLAIDHNPDLLKCDPKTIVGAAIEAAVNGLEIGGMRGEAYLVPFGDQCKLMPGYHGWLKLCYQAGNVVSYSYAAVHAADQFSCEFGTSPKITHVPEADEAIRLKSPITHVYIVFHMRTGAVVPNIWSADKINAHRDQYAKGTNRSDSPWKTAWLQMAVKTIVLDTFHRGMIPISESVQQMVSRESQLAAIGESHSFDLSDLDLPPSPPSITDQTPPPEPTADDQAAFLRAVANAKDVGDIAAVRTLYAGKIDDMELDAACTEREEQIAK